MEGHWVVLGNVGLGMRALRDIPRLSIEIDL